MREVITVVTFSAADRAQSEAIVADPNSRQKHARRARIIPAVKRLTEGGGAPCSH
jgi:hypothetical protein